MTAIRHWQSLGLWGLALLSCGAMAQGDGSTPTWGAHIDVEAKPGGKRTLGEADLFLPIAQDARSLLFANLRARFDNHDSREGNFGLGWRRMQESGWNLGLYGYFDRRRSPDTGFHYNQATLGGEALGRDWEFRANGYAPLGTKARDLGSASTAAISGASIQVTTVDREERALKGFDAELGWRAPLFDSEAQRQLRLYLGGYRFSDGGITVEGPRARAELAMEDMNWFGKGTSLFLGLEAQNDGARGHQNFLSLRVRIPLGKESHRLRPLNAQERRMTAPVMRDVDIVTQSRVASTLVENATATAGGQAVTVLNSASTSGAALPGAVAAAGANSTVVLAGTFNTTATTTLQTGQTLMGAGNLTVTTPSGHTATLAAPGATINWSAAPALQQVVNMGNNSSLLGMTVAGQSAGGGGYAVTAQGTTGATLRDNTLSSSFTSGYTVDLQGSANAVVTGNTISAAATGGGAIGIRAAAATNIQIADNTLTATGTPSYVIAGSNTTSFAAGSTGNVAVNGVCFFTGGAPTGSVGFSTITCP